MTNQKNTEVKVSANGGGFFIAVALLFIAFWGEPDLIDAIVHALTGEYPR